MTRTVSSARTLASNRLTIGGLFIVNSSFDSSPAFTAATTSGNVWVDGTAAGSATNSQYGWSIYGGGSAGSYSSQFDSGRIKLSTTATASKITVTNALNIGVAANITRYGISVLPSTSYTFTYSLETLVNSGSASSGAIIRVREYSLSGAGVTTTASNSIVSTQAPTISSINFTTNASTRYVVLAFEITGNDGAGTFIMDAWIDNLVFVQNNIARLTAIARPFS